MAAGSTNPASQSAVRLPSKGARVQAGVGKGSWDDDSPKWQKSQFTLNYLN